MGRMGKIKESLRPITLVVTSLKSRGLLFSKDLQCPALSFSYIRFIELLRRIEKKIQSSEHQSASFPEA